MALAQGSSRQFLRSFRYIQRSSTELPRYSRRPQLVSQEKTPLVAVGSLCRLPSLPAYEKTGKGWRHEQSFRHRGISGDAWQRARRQRQYARSHIACDLEDTDAFATEGLVKAGTETLRFYLADLTRRGFAPSSQAAPAPRLCASSSGFSTVRACGPTTRRARSTRPEPPGTAAQGSQRDGNGAGARTGSPGGTRAADPSALRLLANWWNFSYGTGLRISELVSLPVSVARTADRFVLVRGKGRARAGIGAAVAHG